MTRSAGTTPKLGPIELSVKDKKTVNIPVWAGVGAIGIGGALLLIGGKKGESRLPRRPPAEPDGEVDPYANHDA